MLISSQGNSTVSPARFSGDHKEAVFEVVLLVVVLVVAAAVRVATLAPLSGVLLLSVEEGSHAELSSVRFTTRRAGV